MDDLYEKLAAGRGVAEDVAFRRITEPMDSRVVLDTVAAELGVDVGELFRRHRGSILRAVAARCLMRYAGQSQRDAGKLLKVGSGAAISRQLSRHSEMFEKGEFAEALTKVERRLTEERQKRYGKKVKF